jgi:hypothetical protein
MGKDDLGELRQLRWSAEFKFVAPSAAHPKGAAEKLRRVAQQIEALRPEVWAAIIQEMLDEGQPYGGLVGEPYPPAAHQSVDGAPGWSGIWSVTITR